MIPFGLHFSIYGSIIIFYLLFKLIAAKFHSPTTDMSETPTVSVIVPEYNEDPELLRRCLDSILAQSYPIADVHVTDDGSDSVDAWEVIKEYGSAHDIIHAHQLPENKGKRHAQKEGFDEAAGEIFVTVDSDTVLEPDAIAELVKPFGDPAVLASTGYPKIINRNDGLLKQLIDMRYWTAFNIERAAQSFFGTVICCCGVLSAYRADVVHEVAEEYVGQEFRGEECTFGDDRHLSAHCLQRGKVVYQPTAQSWTDAPDTIRGYIKQQVRWMRSFWRESLLALRWAPKRSLVLTAMILVEMALPIALVVFGVGSVIQKTVFLGATLSLVYYVLAVALMAYLRNLLYFRKSLRTYVLSPIYGVLYLLFLLPLSFYALSTMTATQWGTR